MTFHELMINFVHDVINYSRKIVNLELNLYEKEKNSKSSGPNVERILSIWADRGSLQPIKSTAKKAVNIILIFFV